MSNPTSNDAIPENIGRNDPCPCGSGRKYKKCCQRAHRLQKETAKKNREPHQLVDAETIPWEIVKLLRQVQQSNALGLFFELAHDESPFRERYDTKSDFIKDVDAGDLVLPVAPDFKLVHTRLDPPDTHLVIRGDDPKKADVDFQIITLRRNEIDADGNERDIDYPGYRIWDYKRHSIPRDDFDDLPPMTDFGIEWRPADA